MVMNMNNNLQIQDVMSNDGNMMRGLSPVSAGGMMDVMSGYEGFDA